MAFLLEMKINCTNKLNKNELGTLNPILSKTQINSFSLNDSTEKNQA